jgi:hypothetical protein
MTSRAFRKISLRFYASDGTAVFLLPCFGWEIVKMPVPFRSLSVRHIKHSCPCDSFDDCRVYPVKKLGGVGGNSWGGKRSSTDAWFGTRTSPGHTACHCFSITQNCTHYEKHALAWFDPQVARPEEEGPFEPWLTVAGLKDTCGNRERWIQNLFVYQLYVGLLRISV